MESFYNGCVYLKVYQLFFDGKCFITMNNCKCFVLSSINGFKLKLNKIGTNFCNLSKIKTKFISIQLCKWITEHFFWVVGFLISYNRFKCVLSLENMKY